VSLEPLRFDVPEEGARTKLPDPTRPAPLPPPTPPPEAWIPPPLPRAEDGSRPLVTGTIWDGRYRIERTLGEGGMGSVLLAADLANQEQPIALKVLRPHFREVATPNFLREYSIQRLLRHPAIPRALALGFDLHEGKEVPYFTMPFVAGESLASIIMTRQPLSSAWRWTIEILEALDAIHRAGYLHRDVKPGNILVDVNAVAGPQARLIDFGITTTLAAEPEYFFTGTPAYCAPESIEGGCHDVRSDLYAVGLVLFELIEGEPPWDSIDIDELLQLRRAGRPATVTHRQCPEAMRKLVDELLDPDLAGRPPSAAAVVERMKEALGISEPLGSVTAFRQRMEGLPVPSPSYIAALAAEGEVVLVHVPDGHDGAQLLDEIGDRGALRGVRAVHVRLEGRPGPPLHELEGALDVFRRLRADESNAEIYRGLAGAATMLTRMHRPTLLVIDGLEHADEAIVAVLRHAFLGARNAHLTVIATLSDEASPRAGRALAAFQAESFVTHLRLEHLTRQESYVYLTEAVGAGVLASEVVDSLHDQTGGRPKEIQHLLEVALEDGVLIRRAAGFEWLELPPEHAVTREDLVPSSDDFDTVLRDRLALLHSPYPIEAVQSYLGSVETYRQLIEAGLIIETDTSATCLRGAEYGERYAALPPERRHELHRQMALALGTLPPYLATPAQAAEQLLLAGRPAAAAPYLVLAARAAHEAGNKAVASAQLARAIDLVRADRTDDPDLASWKIDVFGAVLDEARTSDDAAEVIAAADQLLLVAVRGRHLASIERALAAKIDEAQEAWDVVSATAAVDELLRWQRRCGAPEVSILRTWTEGLELALQGDIGEVLRLTHNALTGAPPEARTSIGRWARRKLLALQAEVAVRGGVARAALSALTLYEEDFAGDEATLLPYGRPYAGAMNAAVWRSTWLRRTNDFTGARAALASWQSALPAPPAPPPEGADEPLAEAPAKVVKAARRAVFDLARAECELALGRCDQAVVHAGRALERARGEGNRVVAFSAEGVLADAGARSGDAAGQLGRLQRLLAAPPLQMQPQALVEVKLRWLAARLQLGEADSLIADALAVAREALRCKDAGAMARAAFVAARAELRANLPVDALRHADWVLAIDRQHAIGGPPRHATEWLLASAHYQLKWFKTASQLSGRAMESLRTVAHTHVGADDRDQWLRNGDNLLIGIQR